jgi:hypothetical protein
VPRGSAIGTAEFLIKDTSPPRCWMDAGWLMRACHRIAHLKNMIRIKSSPARPLAGIYLKLSRNFATAGVFDDVDNRDR